MTGQEAELALDVRLGTHAAILRERIGELTDDVTLLVMMQIIATDMDSAAVELRDAAAYLSRARADIDEAFAAGRASAWDLARAEALEEAAQWLETLVRDGAINTENRASI